MEHNLKHTNCKYFILHISYLKRSEATFCERDSSGTTEPPSRTSGATAAKVMERIARREPQKKPRRTKGAKRGFFCERSGSPCKLCYAQFN
jgi:hypothetical protein